MQIVNRLTDPGDRSSKFLFENAEGQRFEGVYLPDTDFYGYCASTQVGCNMGCSFCATGLQRNTHNLTCEEIVKSVKLMEQQTEDPKPLDFVTLSGMGEPLANYENSMNALDSLRDLYPSITVTSISTIGLRHGLERLIREKRDLRLYVSLHAATNEVRRKLIPLAIEHSVASLVDTVSAYGELNGPDKCRVSYLLLAGVNDRPQDLDRLVDLLKGRPLRLQLLLWNHVDGFDFRRVPDSLAHQWKERLQSEGIDAYIMPSMGRSINAACGQLSAKTPQRAA